MNVDFARPSVETLVFHVYGRSVHPELFRVHAEAECLLERYSAVIRICDAGHTVAFLHRGRILTEVAADGKQLLPTRKRLVDRRLRGCRDESIELETGLTYQTSYQMEKLDLEVFASVHEELMLDCHGADLSYQFPAASRLSPGPLSLVRTDVGPRSLLIHAFHTFPESSAVVRTQSLFEV